MDELSQALRANTARRTAIRREVYNLARRERRASTRNGQGPLEPSPALRAILLLLFFFTGYESELPAEYWEQQRERERLPKLPRAALREKVDDIFMRTDPFDLLELADPQASLGGFLGADDPAALRLNRSRRFARQRAASFLTKMRLRSWVATANASRGLAPMTTLLIGHYNKEAQRLPEGLRPRHLEEPATSSYSRVFAKRWRQLVGAKIGKLRVLDHIPLEEKRAKVGPVAL